MKKKICGIYKFINKINGKVYIGQSIDCNRRKIGHYCSSHRPKSEEYDSHFHRALRKYGRDNFDYEVIEECSKDKLNEREIYWIEYYRSCDNGYNVSRGGHIRNNMTKAVYQIDIKTKKIINTFPSLVEAGESVNGYIGALSQVCNGKLTSAYNYIWCYVDDYYDSKYDNYKRKRQCRSVYALDKKTFNIVKKFDSIVEAVNYVNGLSSIIIQNCTGMIKSCYGFVWCYADEYSEEKYSNYVLDSQLKGVLQFDMNTGQLIAEYYSLNDVEKKTGFKKGSVSFACKGRTKSSHGYIWKYKTDAIAS